MAFTFNSTQLTEISTLLQAGTVDGNYSHLYQKVYEYLTDYTDPNDEVPLSSLSNDEKAIWAWLSGARQANANDGSFVSNFIWEYTRQQYELRNGVEVDDTAIQNASNALARSFIEGILDTGTLHTLADIRNLDVTAISEGLFDGNKAAWSGGVLFPALGDISGTQSWLLNLESGPGKPLSGTYDLIVAAQITENIANPLSSG